MSDSLLTLADRPFRSRLIVGTGKYPAFRIMREAHEASGAEMITVAVRRVDLKMYASASSPVAGMIGR